MYFIFEKNYIYKSVLTFLKNLFRKKFVNFLIDKFLHLEALQRFFICLLTTSVEKFVVLSNPF